MLLNLVDVLIDRVGCPLIPMFVDALLRWNIVDVLIQFSAKEAFPAQIDMSIEACCFVLRQHQHASQTDIEAVGKDKIDDSIDAAKGN